jgi:hypothetical protein
MSVYDLLVTAIINNYNQSFWEVLYIIPDHACNLLKVHLVTAPLYIENLIKEPDDVFLIKIADELAEKLLQPLVTDLVLPLIEYLEQIEHQYIRIGLHIIRYLFHRLGELSVPELIATTFHVRLLHEDALFLLGEDLPAETDEGLDRIVALQAFGLLATEGLEGLDDVLAGDTPEPFVFDLLAELLG